MAIDLAVETAAGAGGDILWCEQSDAIGLRPRHDGGRQRMGRSLLEAGRELQKVQVSVCASDGITCGRRTTSADFCR